MKIKKISVILTAAILLITSMQLCFAAEKGFEYLQLPDEALTEFMSGMLTRISSGDDHLANRGYDETGLYTSPYWTMTVNGENVPVYATPVYDWALDTGVLQSFQVLFLNVGSALNVEMTFAQEDIRDAVMLPESLNTTVDHGGRKLTATLTKPGKYTCLINGEDQRYAITLFVRENTDEDAQIAKLTEQYGEYNIVVCEKGVYSLESIPTDKDCIFFRRGAFVSLVHKKDIRSAEDAQDWYASPVMELNGKTGAVVTGCGILDFTKLDRGERNLLCMNFCRETTVEGLICLNPNGWTLTAYACEDCRVNDVTVFGYRTNSDGVNICGCEKMAVTDSFCRNGDDCFSVKATNTEYECRDVTFTDCIGWSNKARCFGVTGEVERDITDITFSGCAVIYRNAVWDLNRTGSLVIAVETGRGDVRNVTFEDIEIHRDTGRPIYCMIYGDGIADCSVSGVRFRNIVMNADQPIKISSQRELDLLGKFFAKLNNSFFGKIKCLSDFFARFYNATNSVEVSFENVTLNGKALRAAAAKQFDTFGNAEICFVK